MSYIRACVTGECVTGGHALQENMYTHNLGCFLMCVCVCVLMMEINVII